MDLLLQPIEFNMAATDTTDLKRLKNGYNSVKFTNIEPKFGVVVAETHPEHKFGALTGGTRYLFKIYH